MLLQLTQIMRCKHLSKKSKSKAVGRVVRRTLADGTIKEYRYGAYRPAPSRVAPDSLEAMVRAYRRSPKWATLATLTKESYNTYLRPLDGIGHLSAKQVKRLHILSIRDAISHERGMGAATGFMRAASALFGWAVEQGILEVSPTHKIRRLPGGSLKAWSVEQAETALSSLPEHFRRAVILGVYTGQRRGDMCAVEWSAYDGATLTFVQQKSQGKIVVVLEVHPDLRVELDRWKETATADTILTDAKGRPWSPNLLSVTLPFALQAIGLPRGLNVHGLRKLVAAGLADNGATTHQIAAITGHQTLSMVQLYTRTADQRKLAAEASGKMERFTNKPGNGKKP